MSKKSVFTLQLFSLVNSSLNGPPTQGPYSFFFFFSKSRLFYNPASSLVTPSLPPSPKTVKTVKTVNAPPVKGWATRPTSSLIHRCRAYDAKFIGDLISAPFDIPWKVWTLADLRQASLSSAASNPSSWHPNPLTQHAFITLKKLDPRVKQSVMSLRSLDYNIQCAFPSSEA